METVVVDAKFITMAVNFVIAILLAVVPGLRTQWAALSSGHKSLYMVLVGLVLAVGTYAAGCYGGGIISTNITCSAGGWTTLFQVVIMWLLSILGGVAGYVITPEKPDVRAVKYQRRPPD